jgi:hypothetical protein
LKNVLIFEKRGVPIFFRVCMDKPYKIWLLI